MPAMVQHRPSPPALGERIALSLPSPLAIEAKFILLGPRTPRSVGRTGVWFLSTDGLAMSKDLAYNLRFLARLLLPEPGGERRLAAIRELMRREDVEAPDGILVRAEWPKSRAFRLTGDSLQRSVSGVETDFGSVYVNMNR